MTFLSGTLILRNTNLINETWMNSLICYNLKAQQALSETFRVGARGVPFSKGPSRFEWMTDVKSWQILPFLKHWLFLAYLFSDFEYNISFTTFREVPPFLRLQKSWKKNRIEKNRKFHAEDRSGKFSKFLNFIVRLLSQCSSIFGILSEVTFVNWEKGF